MLLFLCCYFEERLLLSQVIINLKGGFYVTFIVFACEPEKKIFFLLISYVFHDLGTSLQQFVVVFVYRPPKLNFNARNISEILIHK